MFATTALAITWLTQTVTPTKAIEITIFCDGSLVERELTIPTSGEAILTPTTDIQSLWVSEQTKGLVHQIEHIRGLYLIQAVPNSKIRLFSVNRGVLWRSLSSVKFEQSRLRFSSSIEIINRSEMLESVPVSLSSGGVDGAAQCKRENGLRFPQRSYFGAGLPVGTDELEYKASLDPVVFKSSLDLFEEFAPVKLKQPEDDVVFFKIQSLTLSEGKGWSSELANGYYPYEIHNHVILPPTYETTSVDYRVLIEKSHSRVHVKEIGSNLPPYQILIRIFGNCAQLGGHTLPSSDSNSAELEMSLFVNVEEDRKEVTRRRVFASKKGEVGEYDLVTVRATIAVQNENSKDQDVLVTKAFLGRFVRQQSGLQVFVQSTEESKPNSMTAFQWNFRLKGKSSKTLTYDYQVFAPID